MSSYRTKIRSIINMHTSRAACCADSRTLWLQLSRSIYAGGSGNELLDFIKVQEPAQLKELTDNASTCVIEAMNSFVQRLLGNDLRRTESNANELARMLYFAMVVGYNLRQLEVCAQAVQWTPLSRTPLSVAWRLPS